MRWTLWRRARSPRRPSSMTAGALRCARWRWRRPRGCVSAVALTPRYFRERPRRVPRRFLRTMAIDQDMFFYSCVLCAFPVSLAATPFHPTPPSVVEDGTHLHREHVVVAHDVIARGIFHPAPQKNVPEHRVDERDEAQAGQPRAREQRDHRADGDA